MAKIIKNLQNILLNMLLNAKKVELYAEIGFAKSLFLID